MSDVKVVFGSEVIRVNLGDSATEAHRQQKLAERWADGAALSSATAEAAAGPTYKGPTAIADGLSETPEGKAFAVDNGDGTVTIYLNDGGVAVAQRTLATTDYLSSEAGLQAIGADGGGTAQQALNRLNIMQVAALIASADPPRGEGTIWRVGPHVYREANSGATDHHLTTAGGVKLYIFDWDGISPEALGAVGDGVADDTAFIQAAEAIAYTSGRPLVLRSVEYRTTASLVIRSRTLIANDATITKDLGAAAPGTPVLRFVGTMAGADTMDGAGSFRKHIGKLTCQQSALPPAGYTGASAFEFNNVIHAEFGQLFANNCYYAYRTAVDPVAGDRTCWGNKFPFLYARGVRGGYLHISFPGFGANTENVFGMCYFNGKLKDSPPLLPKEETPIYLNNSEGFIFHCLNLEWTELNTDVVDSWIHVLNASNICIGAFHPEGTELNDLVNVQMFYFSNNGEDAQANVIVDTWHFNNHAINAGSFHLCKADGASKGSLRIGAVTGNPGSNNFADLRALNTNGDFALVFGERSGVENVLPFSVLRRGTPPASGNPNIWFGTQPYENDHGVSSPTGPSIDVGKSFYWRISGTPGGPFNSITATPRHHSERTRLITLENNSGTAISILNDIIGGVSPNTRLPIGAAYPFSLGAGRNLLISYDFSANQAEIVGASN